MKQIMNTMLLTVAAMILVSCSATSEKSSPSLTPAQGIASPQVQAEAEAQKPDNASPSPSMSPSMCYSVSGKEVKVFNTPWGDKTAKIESPTDEASGGRKGSSLSFGGGTMQGVDYFYDENGSLEKASITIYVGEKREPRINVIYDYSKTGVESVTVDDKETPKCKRR